jgi:hypothetical protein
MLYFFHGDVAAVLSHGITKERTVPKKGSPPENVNGLADEK